MTSQSAFSSRRQLCRASMLLLFLAPAIAVAGDARSGDGPANTATQQISDEARRILRSIRTTEYQHRTSIDEQNGAYRCDCSGLGIYVLNRTVARNDPEGPLGDGRPRPRAMHFFQAFADADTGPDDGGRWQRVERLVDARPGDLVAWRRAVVRPGNSGHVVIIDQRPVVEPDGLVRVVMIDSTTRPLVDDTRPQGGSGIGRGTMWFKVDGQGRPTAYIRGARDSEPVVLPISIGRAKPAASRENHRDES